MPFKWTDSDQIEGMLRLVGVFIGGAHATLLVNFG